MAFHVIEELPAEDQARLERILATPVHLRSAGDTAYLTARADYLDNRIIAEDDDGLITVCSGFTPPAGGQPGFAVGGKFLDRNAAPGSAATYENRGSTTSCDFVLMGGGGGGTGNNADNETPTGTIDGVNATFTLAHAPNPAASLILTMNGTYLTQGVEYTLSGATITFAAPPAIELAGLPFKSFYRY